MNGEKHVTLWDKPQENPLPLKGTGGICPTQPVLQYIKSSTFQSGIGSSLQIVRLLVFEQKMECFFIIFFTQEKGSKTDPYINFLNMFFYTGGLQIGPISRVYLTIVNSSHRRRARNQVPSSGFGDEETQMGNLTTFLCKGWPHYRWRNFLLPKFPPKIGKNK